MIDPWSFIKWYGWDTSQSAHRSELPLDLEQARMLQPISMTLPLDHDILMLEHSTKFLVGRISTTCLNRHKSSCCHVSLCSGTFVTYSMRLAYLVYSVYWLASFPGLLSQLTHCCSVLLHRPEVPCLQTSTWRHYTVCKSFTRPSIASAVIDGLGTRLCIDYKAT